jgi:V8-like Glu-specific endopeptidase
MHRLLLFTVLAGSLAYSAVPQAVAPLEFHAPEQEKLLRTMRRALPSRNHVLPSLRPHTMSVLDNDQLRKNATDGRQIGIHRKLQPVAMQNARRDGRIWRLAVQSPGALAMRLHFTQFAVGAGQVWIHDGGGDEDRVLGPYVGRGPNNDGDFWSATVFSDTVTVEYQPADGQPADGEVPFTIEEISHQFSAQAAPKPVEQSAAASCELDVNCYADWAATAKGVALLSFEKDGESYGCSGTLLNTRSNSFVPYLLTANHCISTDPVARTLEATWFYQKNSCNGALPNQNFPRSIGSTLVVTGDKTKGDFSLLKLTSVPNGVTFQGWDPAEQPLGKPVTVIHHPSGDYKRISFGNVTANITTPQNFYWVQYTAGVTESGSSGSGLYSAPGVLIGTLSTGLISATEEGYCAIKPYGGTHGKFSGFYPLIRDALEGQSTSNPAPPPPGGGTNTLTSGEPFTFTLAPVSQPTVLNGKNGFSINVPEGATRLDILMQTITPNVNVDLYARYGQDVTLNSSGVVADFYSQGPGGVEFIFITRGGSSGLRPGTYYIALGDMTTNTEITGKVMAIVATDGTRPPGSGTPPPDAAGTPLSSGAPYDFSIPAVDGPTLFTGTSGFTIDVPQGATRLDVKLTSATKGGDLDLYVTYGEPTSVDDDGIWADYASEGDDSNESISITAASDPPLKPGTYYIAVASWNPGVKIDATVTATVSTASAPPPPASGGNVLTSGRAQPFTLDPVTGPTIFLGDSGYRIAVPQGATSLDIVLHTTTPNADVDLFARYGQDLAIRNGDIVSDYSSTSETGEERITINASSNPPLRAGTYYISMAAFTAGVRITGTLTATVGTGGGSTPPPAAGPTVLTSGTRQTLLFNPVSDPTFFNGNKSYVIDVPANASKLDIQLTSSTAGADMDLFVSYGKDNGVGSDGFIADYGSTGSDGNERITITPDSKPALRPGRYYISIALYTTKTNVLGSLTATVTGGAGGSGQAPAPSGGGTTLTAGQATRFSLPASSAPTLFNGERSFKILAPASATQMKIQVASDNPSVDVAVLVRYQAEVGVDAQGHLVADYGTDGPTGNETLTITNRSTPPLRSGLYYISLVLISTGVPSTGTITVTFPDDILSRPNTNGTPMTSGIAQSYSMPAVTSPTMFAGSSAYRVSVDKGHSSLRLSLKDNSPDAKVTLYVRRGRQPEVLNGSVVADYVLTTEGGGDVVLEGARLRPGVYYIALGQYSTGVASAGTLTATVTAPDGVPQEFQFAPADGISIHPKASEEVRFELPQEQAARRAAVPLVKHSNRPKKSMPVKVEVSR